MQNSSKNHETISTLGNKPELEWVNIQLLSVDKSYQRSTKSRGSKSNINKLYQEFCWDRCGAIIVSRIDELNYRIIDGQHRYEAACMRGDITELPCIVIGNIESQDQAKRFVDINKNRVGLHVLAKFHAEVAAGDQTAVSLKEILDDIDISIPKTPVVRGKTQPREVQCIRTLMGMIDKYSANNFKWVLTIIPEAYPDALGMLKAQLIKALAEIYKDHHTVLDREDMIKTLQNIEIPDLLDHASTYREIQGGTTLNAIVQALKKNYNKYAKKRIK